jgi:diguanylate cyclase (GGDEF)-like protein
VARAERTGNTVGLLFCDLDAFKTVNDTLGHQEGDRLLVEVARRLVATVRDGDTVARFGGDEFAIMVEDVGSTDEVMELGRRVLDALRPPVTLAGRPVSVGVSIGVATTAQAAVRGPELVSNADAAMYAAKERGKGCVVAFRPEMRIRATRRFELTGDLWHAADEGQLRLHYQPTVRLGTGEITGFEALLRWQHPTRGLIPPLEFIPAAEESGLIVPIGRWVLQTACRDARRWREAHPAADLTIAVNVSARQLRDPGLAADVAFVLVDSDLPGSALVLEVTESVLLDDFEAVEDQLRRIKELGVRLAVDDFGTGYSSFGYLRRYPFDVIKIDRSFVQDAVGRADAAAIVRAMVDLGGSLGLRTVAEGVESVDQAALLTTMACGEAQGFLWSRPVPAEQVASLLEERLDAA